MLWWDTPQGILLLSAYTSERRYGEDGFLSVEDGWWKLQQIFPTLSEYHAKNFPCGQFWPFEIDESHADIVVEFVWGQAWDSNTYIKNQLNLKRLTQAMGIPESIAASMSLFDY